MGLQDRDGYREKSWKSVRNGLSGGSRRLPVKAILTGFAAGLAFWILLKHDHPLQRKYAATVNPVPSEMMIPCGGRSVLPHGAVLVIEPSVMKRSDVLYAGLQIHNRHDYPMVAVLSDTIRSRQLFAASIAADETADFSVPVGHYGMQVFVGSIWCNLESGFSDGASISVDGGISVTTGMTTSLAFYGSGLDPVQLALAYNLSRPANPEHLKQSFEVSGTGKLELLQTRDGHYFSSGTVNGAPIVFLIDTGATTVSISSKIASRAGIQKCYPRIVSTANGTVNACAATVDEVTFGKFQLTNVDVTIMPNMADDALLGMNVLRHFYIEQVDNVMRISSH